MHQCKRCPQLPFALEVVFFQWWQMLENIQQLNMINVELLFTLFILSICVESNWKDSQNDRSTNVYHALKAVLKVFWASSKCIIPDNVYHFCWKLFVKLLGSHVYSMQCSQNDLLLWPEFSSQCALLTYSAEHNHFTADRKIAFIFSSAYCYNDWRHFSVVFSCTLFSHVTIFLYYASHYAFILSLEVSLKVSKS